MKKIFNTLFLVLLAISFVACSSDDDNSIIGSWLFDGNEYEVRTNNDKATKLIKEAIERYEDSDRARDVVTTFEENGKMKVVVGSNTFTYTYTYEKGILTTIRDNGDKDSNPVSISKGIMTAVDDLTEIYQKAETLKELGLTDVDKIVVEKVAINGKFKRK